MCCSLFGEVGVQFENPSMGRVWIFSVTNTLSYNAPLLKTMPEKSSQLATGIFRGVHKPRQPCHIRYEPCPVFLPDQTPPPPPRGVTSET